MPFVTRYVLILTRNCVTYLARKQKLIKFFMRLVSVYLHLTLIRIHIIYAHFNNFFKKFNHTNVTCGKRQTNSKCFWNSVQVAVNYLELNCQATIHLFYVVFLYKMAGKKDCATERTCVEYIIADIFIGKEFCLGCMISDLINGWRSLSDDLVSLEIFY